ncbi:MAG TPA: hypothetical protein VK511_07625 [Gemmatimonadaceae bacterium]|nr:hypothetical protein [Gemmatimonadaceae bacterium]
MFQHSDSLGRARRRAIGGIALIATALAIIACERSAASVPKARETTIDATRTPAHEDSALRFPFLPDPARTPGAALEVTAADICVSGYSKRVRNVPAEVKRRVYALYGVRSHEPGEYEIDHLINLSLGGSNSIRNLWPESFRTSPWNAYVKDQLENELHRRVCAGTMDLAKAQQVIARNWIIGYREYVHPTPLPAGPRKDRRSRARNAPQFQTAVP